MHQIPPIKEEDMVKLYKYFNVNDPNRLQEKVFVDMMISFKGICRYRLRNMKKDDFACRMEPDGNGATYVCMVKQPGEGNQASGSQAGVEDTAYGRMYAIPGSSPCQ